jgi:hypothetical protein
MDGVVPVRVKPMGREPEGGQLLIGDGAALRIRSPIHILRLACKLYPAVLKSSRTSW